MSWGVWTHTCDIAPWTFPRSVSRLQRRRHLGARRLALARLDRIRYTPHTFDVEGSELRWEPSTRSIEGVPVLYWETGEPWPEANLYFADRAELILSGQLKIGTLESIATALLAYMKFLESDGELQWHHFPKAKSDRPVTRFRGELIRARDNGELASSTATARMAGVLQWYRWVKAQGLLSTGWPLWEDKLIGIRIKDAFGFERSLAVTSSELSIPNRKRNIVRLEDGLLPVSLEERDKTLDLAARYSSQEFNLMLRLGFMTGMRLGSICDLKLTTLENAEQLAETPLLHYLSIGPGVRAAPVRTKHDVTGRVIIPTDLLRDLRRYVCSERRLMREAQADKGHKSLVFLSRYGTPYGTKEAGKSPSVNVDMLRLRHAAAAEGVNLAGFHFHRSRATFATSLAEAAMRMPDSALRWSDIISLIRDLLLHKDEATSMRYITFVNEQKTKAYWANEFTRFFFGKNKNTQRRADA